MTERLMGLSIEFLDGDSALLPCYQHRVVNTGPTLLSGASEPSCAELIVRTEPASVAPDRHESNPLLWKRFPLLHVRAYQLCQWPGAD